MVTISGKGVCGKLAFGRLSFLHEGSVQVKREHTENTETEKQRFLKARERAEQQLTNLYQKARLEVGDVGAQIFDIHKMMLSDQDFLDAIAETIETQKTNAEFAVAQTTDRFSAMFSQMEDDYMKERATDVKDVGERLLRCFGEENDGKAQEQNEGVIVCAEDLTPSQTVQMDKSKVLGFVTKKGSTVSHTAILARTMNIPAVIGTGEALQEDYHGKFAVVDGFTGTVYIEPDEKTYQTLLEKQKQTEEKERLLQTLKGKKNIPRDGQEIQIYANIGGLSDLGAVLLNDAGGVGLFRSEFLYLENTDYPTEQQQFEAYKQVLETMAGKKVIIRTLDIGADKKIDYFHLDEEENPALGYRAIRICLTDKAVFYTQLRALWRASVFGTLSVMFPMIIAKEEILAVKDMIRQVEQDLTKEGIPFSNTIEIGIMIETPAAAILADCLAPEVDFFSVGTNDLTQYTLALDRQNVKLAPFFNPHHEAVFRLIAMATEAAHKHGKWIGICGELAADLEVTQRLLALNIDELSVSPGSVLPLREKVRSL